jgi:hypothetical protein
MLTVVFLKSPMLLYFLSLLLSVTVKVRLAAWVLLLLVPGLTTYYGVSCGCPEGPAPICSSASYALPGYFHQPPPWPSHFTVGPQTRGEVHPQSLDSSECSFILFGLKNVMECD